MSGAPTGWSAPKVTWVASDAIGSSDLNRAEGNSLAIETGSRTLDQALASPANTGTLRQIISWFAGRIRAITGKTNWWEAPVKDIEQLNTDTTTHAALNAHKYARAFLTMGG